VRGAVGELDRLFVVEGAQDRVPDRLAHRRARARDGGEARGEPGGVDAHAVRHGPAHLVEKFFDRVVEGRTLELLEEMRGEAEPGELFLGKAHGREVETGRGVHITLARRVVLDGRAEVEPQVLDVALDGALVHLELACQVGGVGAMARADELVDLEDSPILDFGGPGFS
jgi:hypothetical protein